jgi:hypothetical protein
MDVARSYHVRALHEMGAHCRIGDEQPYEVTGVDHAAEPLPHRLLKADPGGLPGQRAGRAAIRRSIRRR